MKGEEIKWTGAVLYDASTGEQIAGYGDHGPCRFVYEDGDMCRREPAHDLHQLDAVAGHPYKPEPGDGVAR